MLKTCILWLSFFFLFTNAVTGHPDSSGREVENTAFQRGERLIFNAAYHSLLTGNITAGDASLEIKPDVLSRDGQDVMIIECIIKTRGLFNLFYKVENHYQSFVDEKSLAPLRFTRNIREGRYRREEDVAFDREKLLAYSDRDTIPTPPFVQDMLSALYFARTFSRDAVIPGESIYLDFHMSDSVYVSRILFEGREQIRTGLGTFNALRFRPQVQVGAIFDQPYPMTLWISDDENKIPLLIESGLKVGSVRLELRQFGGLKNPIDSFVPRRSPR